MKVSSFLFSASIFLGGSVLGFLDTAPFYINKKLDCGHKYITENKELIKSLQGLVDTNPIDTKVIIYKVSNLKLLEDEKKKDGYLQHVHYSHPQELGYMDDVFSSNDMAYLVNEALPSETKAKVTIVEIEDGAEHYIEEFAKEEGDNIFIVQGKPAFKSHASKAQEIESFIIDQYHEVVDNLNVLKQRDEVVDEPSSVEAEFEAAQSLLAEEGDSIVSIYEEHIDDSTPSIASKISKKGSGLFTEYSFFSSGIWMCLIVSLFLVAVVNTVISWMQSLEISYKAFDKQIDFEKKNQ